MFAVKSDGFPVGTVVELQLCNVTKPMTKLDGVFVSSETITCEGEAVVQFSFVDGSEFSCAAGYVTPGVGSGTYEITVTGRKCSIKMILN